MKRKLENEGEEILLGWKLGFQNRGEKTK